MLPLPKAQISWFDFLLWSPCCLGCQSGLSSPSCPSFLSESSWLHTLPGLCHYCQISSLHFSEITFDFHSYVPSSENKMKFEEDQVLHSHQPTGKMCFWEAWFWASSWCCKLFNIVSTLCFHYLESFSRNLDNTIKVYTHQLPLALVKLSDITTKFDHAASI